MTNDLIANALSKDLAVFHARFWRCHRLLHFIACRVLGSPERADDAVENCRLKASRNPPQFEYEGGFRSWLVRVLINEALAILRENQQSAQDEIALRRGSFRARNQLHEKQSVLLKAAAEGEY
jgi:RNA polymerase sigma-70 factor (ECF subfamily)